MKAHPYRVSPKSSYRIYSLFITGHSPIILRGAVYIQTLGSAGLLAVIVTNNSLFDSFQYMIAFIGVQD